MKGNEISANRLTTNGKEWIKKRVGALYTVDIGA